MNDIIPKSYEFEKIKNQLKEFSKQYPENFDFEKVETTTWFFFDHSVTGEELNNTITKIQKHLMMLKEKQLQLVKEFNEIYNALEILDKDYIQKILIAINMANIANEKSKEAYTRIENSQKEIKKSQIDIKTIIENQKRTIDTLIKFKENISYKMEEGQKQLNELYEFKSKLEKDKYFSDLDKMWEEIQIINSEKKEQSEKIMKLITENEEKFQNNINEIQLMNKKIEEVNKKNKFISIFAYSSCLLGIGELIFILWRYL